MSNNVYGSLTRKRPNASDVAPANPEIITLASSASTTLALPVIPTLPVTDQGVVPCVTFTFPTMPTLPEVMATLALPVTTQGLVPCNTVTLPITATGIELPDKSMLPKLPMATFPTVTLPMTAALVRTKTFPEASSSSSACVILRRYHGATSVGCG